jgi:hypothetical protein
MEPSLLGKPTVAQLLKKFPAIYGNRKLIAVLILYHTNPVHALSVYFHNTNFNIILPCMLRFS